MHEVGSRSTQHCFQSFNQTLPLHIFKGHFSQKEYTPIKIKYKNTNEKLFFIHIIIIYKLSLDQIQTCTHVSEPENYMNGHEQSLIYTFLHIFSFLNFNKNKKRKTPYTCSYIYKKKKIEPVVDISQSKDPGCLLANPHLTN